MSGLKNKIISKLPGHLFFLFLVYLAGILFFTLFRSVLFLTNLNKLTELPESQKFELIFSAMLMGFRFDNVISGYILLFPFILLSISQFFKPESPLRRHLSSTSFYLTAGLYTVSFMICSADIPYFNYYFSRLTTAVFNWADETKFMIGMVTKEISYFSYLVVFLIITAGFWFILTRYLRKVLFKPRAEFSTASKIFHFIIGSLLLFVAIRGRIEMKSPIRAGTAFFSAYAFPNQLGLNPVFTFIRSYLDDLDGKSKTLKLTDENEALTTTKLFLCDSANSVYSSPIARLVQGKPKQDSLNVVLIIMESMSADKMARYGSGRDLTPFLDSLVHHSYVFDNFYSAGIHTYNGIYSSLFSYPALLKQHPMKMTNIPSMTGFPVTLRANGYSTIFFTTHDEQFDNMSGFMYANGFEKVVSQKDYPKELVAGPTGVPDHVLFDEALPYLNSLAKKKNPFFAALLTASDHGPYYIPENIPFRPKTTEMTSKIIEYADWSLKHFLQTAEKEPWFKNTVFVFVADHGASLNPVYELPISYVHSPCIMFSPSFADAPRVFSALSGQIDLFPTVMSLLGFRYINNTLGVDLFSERRPCMFFSADEKIGCVNDHYYYLRRADGRESLYKYRINSTIDEITAAKETADSLRRYAFSMMQAAQKLLKDKKTGPQK